MKPRKEWINEWRLGVFPEREAEIGRGCLDQFQRFWQTQKMDDKAKTTRNRYSNALHALGGYLVEQSVDEDERGKTLVDLLREHVGPDEGPLIFHDNEQWQDQIDMVCRKLYKDLKKRAVV